MDPKVTINASDEMRAHLSDARTFQLKRAFTTEISRVWVSLCDQLREEASFRNFDFPEGVNTRVPRIRKGENFHGLPWVLCDFPARFSRESVFALRNFFWWGKGFLFVLHLSGDALNAYREVLAEKLPENLSEEYRISVSGREWEYDPEQIVFEKGPDRAAASLREASFLKVMASLPPEAPDSFPAFFLRFQRDMIGLLHP